MIPYSVDINCMCHGFKSVSIRPGIKQSFFKNFGMRVEEELIEDKFLGKFGGTVKNEIKCGFFGKIVPLTQNERDNRALVALTSFEASVLSSTIKTSIFFGPKILERKVSEEYYYFWMLCVLKPGQSIFVETRTTKGKIKYNGQKLIFVKENKS